MKRWIRRNGSLGASWLVCMAGGLLATAAQAQTTPPPPPPGFKVDGEYGYSLPPNLTPPGSVGHEIDFMIDLMHVFMAALFIGWGIFFVYCLVKFRHREGHRATYELVPAKPSKYIEVAVIGIEAVFLLALSIPAWGKVKNDLPTKDQKPLEVRVVAEQFAWNFHYAGADGEFGRTAPELVDAAKNPVGLDRDSLHGKDDVVSGEFRLVVNRPVIAQITSKDVIHGFALPVLRVKQDAIPGMRIPVWFQAAKEGRYQVACAQLCGNNHYKMLAPMVIEGQAAFDQWLHDKANPKQVEFED